MEEEIIVKGIIESHNAGFRSIELLAPFTGELECAFNRFGSAVTEKYPFPETAFADFFRKHSLRRNVIQI